MDAECSHPARSKIFPALALAAYSVRCPSRWATNHAASCSIACGRSARNWICKAFIENHRGIEAAARALGEVGHDAGANVAQALVKLLRRLRLRRVEHEQPAAELRGSA